MSLLDDVSIVVTPNGYKAGELYAVIPVPSEGAEDVVNGDFASGGASWNTNTGWTITTGIAESVGATADINQGVWSPNAQSQYQVTFEVKTITAGGVRFRFGGVFGATRTSTGIYTEIITTVDTERIRIASVSVDSSYFSGTITNISVKEYTSADMDVTRATAATRVDENGLVNYAEVIGGEEITNGDFDTTIPLGNTGSGWGSIVGDVVYYNGGVKLTRVSSTNRLRARTITGSDNILTQGKQYLLDYSVLENNNCTSFKAYHGGSSTTLNNTVGNHTIYFTQDSSDQVFQFTNNTNNSNITIDNVSVKEVTRDNVPRIDYTGGGCPHILAEPQRTNLVEYSEDFTSWNQIQDTTLTANSTTSPSGENDGTKFLSTGTGAKVRENFSAVSGTTYTFSVYCKNIDATLIKLLGYDGVNSFSNQFQSEVNTSTWTKISLTFTAANTGSGQIQIARDLPDTESAYFWGAQLEVGSYPTSYIPNFGTALGVTRNQDIFTRDGIGSLINDSEGVLFVEMAALSDDLTYRTISLNKDNLNVECVRLRYHPVSNQVQGLVRDNSGAAASVLYTLSDTTQFHKIAYKYKSGDSSLWIDGVEVGTSADIFTLDSLNNLNFNQGTTSDIFFGKVRQLQVYNTVLTDEQLLQLTGTSGTDFYESYAEMASALTYTIQ